MRFGDKVDFCVPTGNFGDILAGYYAKQMGLPVGRLICASNENNVLTDFLTTGTYTAKREFFKTTSPSMDILVSSNLERLLYHVTGSDAEVAGLMRSLSETGSYTVRPETLAAIQESFGCGWSSEEEVAGEIRARYEQDGYLCDTHTAVASMWQAVTSARVCPWWCCPPPLPTSSPQRAGGSGPHCPAERL